MDKLPPFKIRCSSINKIMSASGKLIDGNRTYCDTWIKEYLYDRKASFFSKETAKGNLVEDQSIDFISDLLNIPNLSKNKVHYADQYCQGTPDIVIDDLVIDLKNSWTWDTFPILKKDVPKPDYYWQLQGYMRLTEKDHAKLIYTLTDTPRHLIESEARRYAYQNGYSYDENILEHFIKQMTYPDIDDSLKIKIFDIKRNDADIAKIEEKVLMCRDYIKQKYENF